MDKLAKVIEIIASTLNIEPSALSIETHKTDIPQWDSLAHVQIIAELEAEFDISLPFEKALDIETIGDFANLC